GQLRCDGSDVGRASYDFDGFFTKTLGVTTCGEIRLANAVLRDVFGRRNLQLLTDDGRLLDLKFSDKQAVPANGAAHVDVTGELPDVTDHWRH
ncbi:MAG TPA: hypothetical protein VGC14_09480, partial [Rhizobium sp.]